MKEKLKIAAIVVLFIIGFVLISVLFGDNELAFIFFLMLVGLSIVSYYGYKESVRREEKISKLKEEIRELKNK